MHQGAATSFQRRHDVGKCNKFALEKRESRCMCEARGREIFVARLVWDLFFTPYEFVVPSEIALPVLALVLKKTIAGSHLISAHLGARFEGKRGSTE